MKNIDAWKSFKVSICFIQICTHTVKYMTSYTWTHLCPHPPFFLQHNVSSPNPLLKPVKITKDLFVKWFVPQNLSQHIIHIFQNFYLIGKDIASDGSNFQTLILSYYFLHLKSTRQNQKKRYNNNKKLSAKKQKKLVRFSNLLVDRHFLHCRIKDKDHKTNLRWQSWDWIFLDYLSQKQVSISEENCLMSKHVEP
jgi:hypothetical protein